MIKTLSPFALGATLYMPATRSDILDVVSGTRFPELRSLVVCLEDAVAAIDVDSALANLRALLMNIDARGGRAESGPLLFVRPRDAAMAAVLERLAADEARRRVRRPQVDPAIPFVVGERGQSS